MKQAVESARALQRPSPVAGWFCLLGATSTHQPLLVELPCGGVIAVHVRDGPARVVPITEVTQIGKDVQRTPTSDPESLRYLLLCLASAGDVEEYVQGLNYVAEAFRVTVGPLMAFPAAEALLRVVGFGYLLNDDFTRLQRVTSGVVKVVAELDETLATHLDQFLPIFCQRSLLTLLSIVLHGQALTDAWSYIFNEASALRAVLLRKEAPRNSLKVPKIGKGKLLSGPIALHETFIWPLVELLLSLLHVRRSDLLADSSHNWSVLCLSDEFSGTFVSTATSLQDTIRVKSAPLLAMYAAENRSASAFAQETRATLEAQNKEVKSERDLVTLRATGSQRRPILPPNVMSTIPEFQLPEEMKGTAKSKDWTDKQTRTWIGSIRESQIEEIKDECQVARSKLLENAEELIVAVAKAFDNGLSTAQRLEEIDTRIKSLESMSVELSGAQGGRVVRKKFDEQQLLLNLHRNLDAMAICEGAPVPVGMVICSRSKEEVEACLLEAKDEWKQYQFAKNSETFDHDCSELIYKIRYEVMPPLKTNKVRALEEVKLGRVKEKYQGLFGTPDGPLEVANVTVGSATVALLFEPEKSKWPARRRLFACVSGLFRVVVESDQQRPMALNLSGVKDALLAARTFLLDGPPTVRSVSIPTDLPVGRIVGTGGAGLRKLEEACRCPIGLNDDKLMIYGNDVCLKRVTDELEALKKVTPAAEGPMPLERISLEDDLFAQYLRATNCRGITLPEGTAIRVVTADGGSHLALRGPKSGVDTLKKELIEMLSELGRHVIRGPDSTCRMVLGAMNPAGILKRLQAGSFGNSSSVDSAAYYLRSNKLFATRAVTETALTADFDYPTTDDKAFLVIFGLRTALDAERLNSVFSKACARIEAVEVTVRQATLLDSARVETIVGGTAVQSRYRNRKQEGSHLGGTTELVLIGEQEDVNVAREKVGSWLESEYSEGSFNPISGLALREELQANAQGLRITIEHQCDVIIITSRREEDDATIVVCAPSNEKLLSGLEELKQVDERLDKKIRDAVIETVPIKKEDVAKILGQRGATIRDLRNTSGANIDIKDDSELIISGTAISVRLAKRMISSALENDDNNQQGRRRTKPQGAVHKENSKPAKQAKAPEVDNAEDFPSLE